MKKEKLKLIGITILYVLLASTLVTAIPDILGNFTSNKVFIEIIHILGYLAYLAGCAVLGWIIGGLGKKR